MPYKCPAAGCTRSFSTPKGLNSHLLNAASCKWYKVGKGRELDMEEYGGMDLPDGLVDEVDEELFQLIPLGASVWDRGEQKNHNLYPDDTYVQLGQGEEDDQVMMDVDVDINQGQPIPGPSRHPHSLLAEEEDTRVTQSHPTAGRVIRIDQTVHAKWRQQFGISDLEEDESQTDEGSDDENEGLFYPFASRLDWEVACWVVQEGIGHKAFDRLLAIPGVSETTMVMKSLISPYY